MVRVGTFFLKIWKMMENHCQWFFWLKIPMQFFCFLNMIFPFLKKLFSFSLGSNPFSIFFLLEHRFCQFPGIPPFLPPEKLWLRHCMKLIVLMGSIFFDSSSISFNGQSSNFLYKIIIFSLFPFCLEIRSYIFQFWFSWFIRRLHLKS